MKMRSIFILFCISISFTILARNKNDFDTDTTMNLKDSSSLNHKRIIKLAVAGGVAYTGAMIGFYHFDYQDKLQSHFHIGPVTNNWRMHMDETHHATASYYIGRIGFDLLHWAGMNETRATWIGGLSGFIMLSSQEILDGFSTRWGASFGDLTTNALGSAFFISQQLLWHDQRMVLKWSYHPTSFPAYCPEELGRNSFQKMIKDYNGQTFWISANLKSFSNQDSHVPRWFNIALGLGATGITGPVNENPVAGGNPNSTFEPRRLYYIAPDIDLTKIHTKSKTLKWFFEAFGFLKFPLPALELSGKGLKFKPFYF
jgi:hypothetical protein